MSSYQKYDDNDDYNILPILSSNNSDNKIAYEHIESGHLDFAVIGFPKCGKFMCDVNIYYVDYVCVCVCTFIEYLYLFT